jgi:ubiquinone/menaquinone biosynthesis C-methylase UbiE
MNANPQSGLGSAGAAFFAELYLPYYTALQTPAWAVRDEDFLCSRLNLAAGARVLDLCCGHGRVSLELARRGFEVTGLDLSAAALEKARTSAAEAKLSVRWVEADMRAIPFEAEFDACINWLAAFGLLESDEEDQQALAVVSRALRPGGRLLLETVNQAWLLRHYQPRAVLTTPAGTQLREERHFDLLSGRNYVRVRATEPDGTCRESSYHFRIYTLVELARMLSAAGLHVTGTWGDLDGSPYGLDSRRMIVRADKR